MPRKSARLNTRRFYVYALCWPDGTPFYIGKGQGYRINQHEGAARRGVRGRKCNTIRQIWAEGGVVGKRILLDTDDERDAYAEEIRQIALHRTTIRLANIEDGGGDSVRLTPDEEVEVRAETCPHCTPDSARWLNAQIGV